MKKLIKYLIFLLIVFLPLVADAAGGLSVSPTYLDVVNGSTGSFNVCLNNAAGRVDLAVAGNIAINQSSVFLDEGCTTVVVTGKANGSASVSVTVIDGTTYDDEDITGRKSTVYVNVYTPSDPVTPPSNPKPKTPTTPKENLSGDNSLSSLTIGEYEVTNEGDTYKALVPNDIATIDISVRTTESHATVSGAGKKDLAVGDNTFTVEVTAQNGSVKKYTVVVTRKSEYYALSELIEALKEDKKSYGVKLVPGDILTTEILEAIKTSKKNVNLYYYNEENILLYTWLVKGAEVTTEEEFNPILNLNVEEKEDIMKNINYVESLIFKVESNVPKGIKLRFNVADKYTSKDEVYSYSFVNGKISFSVDDLDNTQNLSISKSGFYEMTPDVKGVYIITKGSLINDAVIQNFTKTKTVVSNKYVSLVFVELAIIIGLVIYIVAQIIAKKPKTPKKEKVKKEKTKKEEIVAAAVPTEEKVETPVVEQPIAAPAVEAPVVDDPSVTPVVVDAPTEEALVSPNEVKEEKVVIAAPVVPTELPEISEESKISEETPKIEEAASIITPPEVPVTDEGTISVVDPELDTAQEVQSVQLDSIEKL